ncbi:MAG: hypothetical protein NC824_04250 [Candidatus Omnitrophica bacterium]|nr:hypothetical protein [Candidatus Omnitrophota bacterium]
MKVDNAYVKAFSGTPVGSIVDFKDGVAVKKISRDFVVFVIASDDGKAIKDSRKLIYTIVSTSHNTGYKEDISKLQFFTQAGYKYPLAWSIVENEGGLPIIVERVSAEIILPWKAGTHKKFDFFSSEISSERFSEVLKIKETEPVFIGTVSR